MQCTLYVTLSHFCASIFLQWKIKRILHILIVQLDIQLTLPVRLIVMCSLSGCAVFFHIKCVF